MAFPQSRVVLVCGRVGDPYCTHGPEDTTMTCCDCGHEVKASPTTMFNHHQTRSPIVCVQCYARHRDEGNATILLWQDRKHPG